MQNRLVIFLRLCFKLSQQSPSKIGQEARTECEVNAEINPKKIIQFNLNIDFLNKESEILKMKSM